MISYDTFAFVTFLTTDMINHGEYRFTEKKFKHFSRTFSRTFSQFSRTFSLLFQVHRSKKSYRVTRQNLEFPCNSPQVTDHSERADGNCFFWTFFPYIEMRFIDDNSR